MGATEKLARFVIETPSEKISDEAIERATAGLMDAVGTALVANTNEIGRIITEFTEEVGGTPVSRVIGTNIKTSSPNAALANGTLGHADDYDDVGGFGHPAVILMPTVLALGEQLGKTGREILDAYVLGFDVGARLAQGIGGDHYERGWHSTVTLGTLASAAAASRLMGLTVDQTRHALGIAASHAAGMQANFGTMTKPLHPGNGARSGITAATLASKGYTANQNIIEAPLGYVAVFGDKQANINAMTHQLGDAQWQIVNPGFKIKEWPCCYGNHGAVPMLIDLVHKYEIQPDQVESVEFIGGMGASGFLNRPDTDTYFGGKFSLQFNIAAAVVDGAMSYDTFTDEKVNSPEIRDMMSRVELKDDIMTKDLPGRIHSQHRDQTVVINMKDGRSVSDTIETATNTLVGHEIDVKFEANASKVLPSEKVERALSLLKDLKNVKDISEVLDAVTV